MIVDKLKKIVTTLGGSYTAKDDTVSELLEQLNTAFENGGGGGSGLPAVTTDDNGKLLGVTGGEWGKVEAPTVGAGVVRVPFTLTVDTETGTISGETTANFTDTLAAFDDGKLIYADVVQTVAGATAHLCGVMQGQVSTDGTADKFTVAVIDATAGGTGLAVYRLKWEANNIIVSVFNLSTT